MTWGLVAVITESVKLEEIMIGMCYNLLPHLDVNRCISKQWSMLPEMYQGLGLADFLVLPLAAYVSLSVLQCLQCNCESPGLIGDMSRFNCNAFLARVKLYGNSFEWCYEKTRIPVKPGMWFHNTWEMAFHLGIQVKIHKQFRIGLVREGDCALMRMFLSLTSRHSTY